MNLPLGALRLRRRGSSGGHRGLQSILSELESPDFPRLRLGIGTPPEGVDASDYVLHNFLPQERDAVNEMIPKAVETIERYLTQGIEVAMHWINRRKPC